MLFLSENTCILSLFLLLIMIILIIYFTLNYQQIKVTETTKLNAVFLEIEVERKNSLSLKDTSVQINKLELQTKASFQKIKVEIFNIDFSYKEVLKNLYF